MLIGHKQKIQIITKSNLLLEGTATASMTVDSQPAEPAYLRGSISAGSGTVTYTGTDEDDAVITETLTYVSARDYLTGQKFKSVTGITTALTGSPVLAVTAENASGEPVNTETTGDAIAATFYELPSTNRIYQSLGILDKVLYYVKLSKRWESLIDNTVKFKVVGRGDAIYEAATKITRVYSPNSNYSTELQFYATEVKIDG